MTSLVYCSPHNDEVSNTECENVYGFSHSSHLNRSLMVKEVMGGDVDITSVHARVCVVCTPTLQLH